MSEQHLTAAASSAPDPPTLEPLLGEIAQLLGRAEADDDPARMEQTLTDGYAQALTLEAECSSLERRVRQLTLALGDGGSTTSEVSAVARRLDACELSFQRLRGELSRLRERHSLAVRTSTA